MFHTMDVRKVVENLEEFDDAREVRALIGLTQSDEQNAGRVLGSWWLLSPGTATVPSSSLNSHRVSGSEACLGTAIWPYAEGCHEMSLSP